MGKKVVVLALVCLFAVGLAACGGSDEDTSSGGSTTAAERLSGTVTVWDIAYKAFPDATRAADQIDAEFEKKYPGVTVNHVAQPLARYDQVLQAAFTGRKGPDVMGLLAGETGILHWTQGLENLTETITDEQRENLDGWASCSENFDVNGDAYGIPYGTQAPLFYYNKKLFRRAGLPTDFEPQTWDEVLEAGKKLKAAGIQAFTGGNREGYENNLWLAVGWPTVNTQEQAIGLSTGETKITDPAFAKALEPERMMVDAGLYPDDWFSTSLWPDGEARFANGEGAMFLGFIEVASHYYNFNPKLGEENVGFFWPPGRSYIATEANCWSIPSFAQNKEAARAYIDFITNRDAMQTLYDVGKWMPNDKRVELAADAPVQERQIIEDLRSSDLFHTTHLMLPGPVFNQYRLGMNEVLQGRKTMEEAQEALQQMADRN